jgi:hypothetical protein
VIHNKDLLLNLISLLNQTAAACVYCIATGRANDAMMCGSWAGRVSEPKKAGPGAQTAMQAPDHKRKMVELVHGAWYTWHRRLWDTTLAGAVLRNWPSATIPTNGETSARGTNSHDNGGGSVPRGGTSAPALLLADAPQTRLAVQIVGGSGPTVSDVPTRLLALKLLSREIRT